MAQRHSCASPALIPRISAHIDGGSPINIRRTKHARDGASKSVTSASSRGRRDTSTGRRKKPRPRRTHRAAATPENRTSASFESTSGFQRSTASLTAASAWRESAVSRYASAKARATAFSVSRHSRGAADCVLLLDGDNDLSPSLVLEFTAPDVRSMCEGQHRSDNSPELFGLEKACNLI